MVQKDLDRKKVDPNNISLKLKLEIKLTSLQAWAAVYLTILKGTLSPYKKISFMKDITSINTLYKVNILFEYSFNPKIADLL